jgi:hypothetical protein
MKLPPEFPAATVLDQNGQPVVLSTLWSSQTRVLVFLRHYG